MQLKNISLGLTFFGAIASLARVASEEMNRMCLHSISNSAERMEVLNGARSCLEHISSVFNSSLLRGALIVLVPFLLFAICTLLAKQQYQRWAVLISLIISTVYALGAEVGGIFYPFSAAQMNYYVDSYLVRLPALVICFLLIGCGFLFNFFVSRKNVAASQPKI